MRINTFINKLLIAVLLLLPATGSCQSKNGAYGFKLLQPCVENEVVHAYMTQVSYREGDYTYTEMTPYHAAKNPASGRKDSPRAVELGWEPDMSGNYTSQTITISDEMGFYKAYELAAGDKKLSIYNLIPGRKYEAVLMAMNGRTGRRDVLSKLSFTPTGQVRMIRTPSIRNVRDLGGWESERFRHADGSPMHIRYGRIYRGAEMDRSKTLTQEDKDIFLNDLKITADLDFRSDKECQGITWSPLGEEVEYFRIATSNYSSSVKSSTLARDFRWMLEKLREGKNVFFHCAAGADRTGTMGWILEGVLGVAEGDVDKDYELTSFYGWRSRKVGEKFDYGNMVFTYYEVFYEQTQGECAEAYLKKFGITQEEIDEFRRIMLE